MNQQRELGTKIDTRYLLESVLGSGASGTVYLATDADLARQVAIKLLNLSSVIQSDIKGRFEREAKALNQLLHPNIVRVYRFGILEDGSPFLVMEYLEGRSLRSLLEEKKQLNCNEAVFIAQQLASALEYAHSAGIVHRDLKPENVIISEGPMGKQAKVIDFGLCKQTDPQQAQETLTQTGHLLGTAMYMSPEQCMGKGIDWRTDIYSFGCLLFEMITGDPPFTGDSHASILLKQLSDPMPAILELSPACGLPIELQELILGCGKKKKEERIQSFADVQKQLTEIAGQNCNKSFERLNDGKMRAMRAARMLPKLSSKFVLAALLIFACGAVGLSFFLLGSDSGNDVLTRQMQNSLSVDDAIKGLTATVKQLVDSKKMDAAMRIVRQSSNSRRFATWSALDRERLFRNYIQIFSDAKDHDRVFWLKVKLLQEMLDSVQPRLNNQKKKHSESDSERDRLYALAQDFLNSNLSQLEWTQLSQAIESSWTVSPRVGALPLWVLRCEALRCRANINEDESKSIVKLFYVAAQHSNGQHNFEMLKKMVDEGVELGMKYGVYNRTMLLHSELGNFYLDQGKIELARAELKAAEECAEGHDLSDGEIRILEDFREGCRIGKYYRHKRKPGPPKGISRIERYVLSADEKATIPERDSLPPDEAD